MTPHRDSRLPNSNAPQPQHPSIEIDRADVPIRSSHPGGRHAVPGLLARRFPGVFRTLIGLQPIHKTTETSRVRSLAYRVILHAARQGQLWRERARTRALLARLSDLDLRDLGLTRNQVVAELNKPFWRC
jgi:uncharacterized protein YjiS (DUF1127 family)